MGMIPSLLRFSICPKSIGLAVDHTPPGHLISVAVQIARARIRFNPAGLTDTVHKEIILSIDLCPALCRCAAVVVVFQDAVRFFPTVQSVFDPSITIQFPNLSVLLISTGARMSGFVKAVLHSVQHDPAGVQLSGLRLEIVVFSVYLRFALGERSICVGIADIAVLFDPAGLQKVVAAKIVELIVDLIQPLRTGAGSRRDIVAMQSFAVPPRSLTLDRFVNSKNDPCEQTQAHQYYTDGFQRPCRPSSARILRHAKPISFDLLAFHSHLPI